MYKVNRDFHGKLHPTKVVEGKTYMPRTRRSFDKDFKENAVKYFLEHKELGKGAVLKT